MNVACYLLELVGGRGGGRGLVGDGSWPVAAVQSVSALGALSDLAGVLMLLWPLVGVLWSLAAGGALSPLVRSPPGAGWSSVGRGDLDGVCGDLGLGLERARGWSQAKLIELITGHVLVLVG